MYASMDGGHRRHNVKAGGGPEISNALANATWGPVCFYVMIDTTSGARQVIFCWQRGHSSQGIMLACEGPWPTKSPPEVAARAETKPKLHG